MIGHIIVLLTVVLVLLFLFMFLTTHKFHYMGIALVILLISLLLVNMLVDHGKFNWTDIYNFNKLTEKMENKEKEEFITYVRKPFGYVWTGADPPHFFKRPSYRTPYRNGFKVYKSYPFPHYGPLDLGPQV